MAQGDGALYNNFKEQLMEGIFNFLTDALYLTLHTGYTPDIDTHTVWADVSATEYGTAAGYTAGGETLGGVAVTQDDANNRGKFDATDVTWTSLGPLTPATPSHCILWDGTPAGDPLVAYWEIGTTATNGGNYTIQWHTDGIILLT